MVAPTAAIVRLWRYICGSPIDLVSSRTFEAQHLLIFCGETPPSKKGIP